MKKNRRTTTWLWILTVTNVALIAVVYHIGWNKTNYLHKICYRYGLLEAPEVESPDFWALDGWTNTLKQMNYDADIVFFGNSITRGSNFNEYFPDKKICNLGYPGDNLFGMAKRVEMGQLQAVTPEKIFIMGGINGLKSLSLEQFEQAYRHLIVSICDSLPNASLYLESILPINHQFENGTLYADNEKITACNTIIKNIADSIGATYINLYSIYETDGELKPEYTIDGVHIRPEHYDKWAEAITPFIYETK